MTAYQLLERLGTDDRVHRARRNDIVAAPMVIKRLDPASVGDLRRLRSVAERVARIGSPALVGIVDCHVEADHVIVVTPAVDGIDLATRQSSHGRPSPAETVGLTIELLDALAALHAHGITHGSVHDRNVLIGSDGRLRLVDIALHTSGALLRRPIDDIVDAFATIRTLVDPGTTDPASLELLRLSHELAAHVRSDETIPAAAALADRLRTQTAAATVPTLIAADAPPEADDARPLLAAGAMALTVGIVAGAVLSTTPGF